MVLVLSIVHQQIIMIRLLRIYVKTLKNMHAMQSKFRVKTSGTLIKATGLMEIISIDFKWPLLIGISHWLSMDIIGIHWHFHAWICTLRHLSTAETFCLACVECWVIFNQIKVVLSYPETWRSIYWIKYCNEQFYAISTQMYRQLESYIVIICKTLRLILRSRWLTEKEWERILSQSLHLIRSLSLSFSFSLTSSISCTTTKFRNIIQVSKVLLLLEAHSRLD